eukprot:Tbor_TRINITY_DN7599_c0_g1::TRINITY_DN7599_c0_g1_i1::g.908::m.908
MKFFIDEIPIIFPYPQLYPEQLDYMTTMKRGLDQGVHMVLEMPSGTGKTVCLLSLLLGYTQYHRYHRSNDVSRSSQEAVDALQQLDPNNNNTNNSSNGICMDDVIAPSIVKHNPGLS